jgi:glutamine synthetase
VASATYVLNTVVAESLEQFRSDVDELLEQGVEKSKAVMKVIRKFMRESKDILFEGNGYSHEWEVESERRGLRAIKNVPDSYDVYHEPTTQELFTKMGVLAKNEIEARYEILNETYIKKLQIEARVMGDMCLNHVIPAAVKYQNTFIANVKGMKDIFGDEALNLCSSQMETLRKLSVYINELSADVEQLIEERRMANRIEDMSQRAKVYSRNVKNMMDKVRYNADHLERVIDDEIWPLPKYRELLFF